MPRKKKRVVMSRLVGLKEADDSFDLEFWKRVGAEGRFAAAWAMVCDLKNWNPRYASQQRLRRTVSSLKYRAQRKAGRPKDKRDLEKLLKVVKRKKK
ncbi:MAG: hypothetical protein HYU99_06960 [Deltaproteobacteria bacterium]|nr:hypothetical protein [Deltaproteobacteria bacterium]